MATASRIGRPKEVKTTTIVNEQRVLLDLSIWEAETLLAIFQHIGGHPDFTRRVACAAMNTAICGAGVTCPESAKAHSVPDSTQRIGYRWVDPTCLEGNIYFKDEAGAIAPSTYEPVSVAKADNLLSNPMPAGGGSSIGQTPDRGFAGQAYNKQGQ